MKTIFLGKAGSHSYGTNTATSDKDFRGIFLADPKFIRTPFYTINEFSDPKEKDSKSYELNKFMKLYSDCNPNIVELLWVDDEDIVTTSPAYELLRSHRHELLCSKVAFTFSGYAISQLKAMKNQSKWENNPRDINPPKQTDYVSLVVNFTADKMFQINIEDFQDGHQLVHYGGNIYGLYQSKGHSTFTKTFHLITNSEHFEHTDSDGNRRIPLHVIKFNIQEYQQTLDDWTNYWNWRNLKDKKVQLYGLIENELAQRNSETRALIDDQLTIDQVVAVDDMVELLKTMKLDNLTDLLHLCKRHLDFKAVGVDFKHGMHLVRLLRMCREILEDGVVNVRRKDFKELLEIRNGSWTYDQLIAYGEEQDKYIREVAYPNTTLRKKPNIELATDLILKIQDMMWTKA